MSRKKTYKVLQETVEEEIPAKSVDLWHQINQKIIMKRTSAPKRRVAIALVATFAALIIIFFTTPVYEVLGQIFVELFPKTESNIRPNYPYLTSIAEETAMAELNETTPPAPTDTPVDPTRTPEPTASPVDPTRTPEPSSRESATMTIEEVEQVAGFDVLEPAYLPHARPFYGAPSGNIPNTVSLKDWQTVLVPANSSEAMDFFGASYDPETNIVYLFYRRFVIKQEPITGQQDCDLCTEVGGNAKITPVQIGDISGEIVIGVWKLVDENQYWENDPWIQRLRWESDTTVFEIGYFYLPGSLTFDSFVEMAESMH